MIRVLALHRWPIQLVLICSLGAPLAAIKGAEPGDDTPDLEMTYSLPDLAVQNITVLPAPPLYANETEIHIWVEFENIGDAPTDTNETFILMVWLNDLCVNPLGWGYANYGPGQGVNQHVFEGTLDQGEYFIQAEIDWTHTQDDSDEGNNRMNGHFTVLEPEDTNPPPPPQLLTPANGAELSESMPTLDWTSVSDPEGNGVEYDCQVATNSSFTNVVAAIYDTITSNYTVGSPLATGRYYWRVRSHDSIPNYSGWSGYRYFDIVPLCECNDGICDTDQCGENQCNCPEDCGWPPSTETNCTDGVDEDCDNETDCDDSDCSTDPACGGCTYDYECDDANACTDDVCANGVCQNTPNFDTGTRCCDPASATTCFLNDGNPCTSDFCSLGGAYGNCIHDAASMNGTACDDGESCLTVDDICSDGVCVGQDIETIACTTDSDCQALTGGLASCNTTSGFCWCGPICPNGDCESPDETPVTCPEDCPCYADADCADDDACSVDRCNTSQMCENTPVDLNEDECCDPDYPDTLAADLNGGGYHTHWWEGAPSPECVVWGFCDPGAGCAVEPQCGWAIGVGDPGLPCYDGDPCTVQDFCDGWEFPWCLPGPPVEDYTCTTNDDCRDLDPWGFDDGFLCLDGQCLCWFDCGNGTCQGPEENATNCPEDCENQHYPTMYALLIGVDYPAEGRTHDWSDDAKKLKSALQAWGNWNESNIIALTGQVEKDDIELAIQQIENIPIQGGDGFLFYYSGHGYYGGDYGEAPVTIEGTLGTLFQEDVSEGDEVLLVFREDSNNPATLRTARLSDDELASYFSGEPWETVDKSFFFDTCLSGGYWGGWNEGFSDRPHGKDLDMLEGNSTRVFAAAAEDEYTSGSKFSKRLRKALRRSYPNADTAPKDGEITNAELGTYMSSFDAETYYDVPIKAPERPTGLWTFSAQHVYYTNSTYEDWSFFAPDPAIDDVDTDGDGMPDGDDLDDDNDGVVDEDDIERLDPTVCEDFDLDGCGDCSVGSDGFGPLPDNDPTDDGMDSDADGICDAGDGCPWDAGKVEPGTCGCGVPDTGDADGDGVLDCVDQCPGADDTVDSDANGIPDCLETDAIPTLSEWGVLVMSLLLLVGLKLRFGRREVA